jgi:hypothetical protein
MTSQQGEQGKPTAADYWSSARRFKPLRTAAQTAVALIGTNAVGITDVDWGAVGSTSALAGVLAVLMALADGSSLFSR